MVTAHPDLCCEVYGHEGKAGPPLEVVYHPAVRGKYEGRPFAKREAAIGVSVLSCGVGLIALDAMHGLTLPWAYIVGAKLVIAGGSYAVRGVAGLYEHRHERRA